MNPENIAIFVVTVLVGCAGCADDFPSSITRFKFEDEQCLVNTWNTMMHAAEKDGIPELGLPPADKHFVDKQEISIGSNVLTLKLSWHNVTVSGMARTEVKHIKGFKKDPKEMTVIEMSGFTPYMNLSGRYIGSGKLLLLQVGGEGNGEIHFYNTTFEITVLTKTEEKDGELYLTLTKVRSEYHCNKHRFKFDNVLNNKEITDSLNSVVNQNHELFAKEANKPVSTSFSRIFKEILTPIFARYPYRIVTYFFVGK